MGLGGSWAGSRASSATALTPLAEAGAPNPPGGPGRSLRTVKERGEQDARDRLSSFIGCQHTWRPARRFLTKILQFLSAVGSPKPDLACQSFRPLHRSDAPAFSRSASSLMAAPP